MIGICPMRTEACYHSARTTIAGYFESEPKPDSPAAGHLDRLARGVAGDEGNVGPSNRPMLPTCRVPLDRAPGLDGG
jgi:hypothetical protein